ncbi:hypothetical protein ACFL4F_00620 [Candidatus Margulisiibacteriota bacterium]
MSYLKRSLDFGLSQTCGQKWTAPRIDHTQANILSHIDEIEAATRLAERNVAPADLPSIIPAGERLTFSPSSIDGAIRGAVVRSTPINHLLQFLQTFAQSKQIDLSGLRAGILGSGFGASGVAFASQCREVVLFDIIGKYINAAKLIYNKFGITNAEFRHEDFVNADLSDIDILYIYAPFFTDCQYLISNTLGKMPEGTIVISRDTPWDGVVIGSKNYARLYPETPKEFTLAEFTAVVRIKSS